MSFRCALKEDIDATSAELVYGTTLRLPGDFYDPSVKTNDLRLYVKKLREYMILLKSKRDIFT